MTISLRAPDRVRGFAPSDAEFLAAFRKQARDAGWSIAQIEGMLDRYAEIAHRLPETVAGWDAWVRQAAADLHLVPEQLETLAGAKRTAKHGSSLRTLHTAIRDRVRRREIEDIMQTDPRRYWRDVALQEELFSLLERVP